MFLINKIDELVSTSKHLEMLVKTHMQNGGNVANIENFIPEYYTIQSCYQKSGRGTASNIWRSEYGKNALFSFIMYPQISAVEQFMLTKLISLGIMDALKNYVPKSDNLKIKWPNDIYYCNKKLGGILMENSIIGNKLRYSIVGVGINVNQNTFLKSLPNPTSISLITELINDVDELIIQILNAVKKRQIIAESTVSTVFDEDYLNMLYNYKCSQRFVIDKKIVEAVIHGVNEYGMLQLLMDDYSLKEYSFKELKFIIPE
jgi:BirA family biotin operon repressor/biotin-[acetyl-CoA-carboxylase] ligase